jgi:hypothetical protein
VLLAIVGVAVGIPLSMWSSKYLSSLLVGLTPRDPVTFAVKASMLVAVASLAGYLPARRAAMADPARALRDSSQFAVYSLRLFTVYSLRLLTVYSLRLFTVYSLGLFTVYGSGYSG